MDKISVNPQIHFGKPCVAGTRITIQSVLELLNEELSFESIIQKLMKIKATREALNNQTVAQDLATNVLSS